MHKTAYTDKYKEMFEMAETKEFQAESKKLMDMMINSIYTNKEIFLRELISNASDAIDKLYYKSLTDTSVGMNKGDFRILLTRDKDSRTLTVSDNGIGMTKEELEKNLGTIAQITEYQHEELEEEDNSIPADPTVRNFSYTILDDKIYFRENSRTIFISPIIISGC